MQGAGVGGPLRQRGQDTSVQEPPDIWVRGRQMQSPTLRTSYRAEDSQEPGRGLAAVGPRGQGL